MDKYGAVKSVKVISAAVGWEGKIRDGIHFEQLTGICSECHKG